MFERFTDRARRVVVLAQDEARALNHNYIGTEHLLLGLIHEGEGVAAKALESMDISLDAVRSQVIEIIGEGQSAPTGHIPFTPRGKKVFELSMREALQLGHNYIGTEHLLLGLLREGEGVAAQVLTNLGGDLSSVRQTVMQMLSGYEGKETVNAGGPSKEGTPSGSAADFTTFSFHAVKNLTTAEGGAVTWRPELGLDEELYRQYMLLSLHGQSKDALSKTRLGAWEYDVVSPAYKCNMTDVCAAIGLAQMTRYDSMLERRRQIITRYDQALAPAGVTSLRHYEDGSVSSGHLYLANLPGLGEEARNEFIERMARADVACNVHYKPLPLLSAYRDLGFSIEDFPQAYALYASEVSLPLHTSLTDEQVDYVISCALETLAAMGRS